MSVGTQLREARAQRQLSLADVSRQTKIQPWVLEALEADRLPELMSPIYVKGFLSSYARFLHLPPAPLVAQLAWPTPTEEPAPAVPPARPTLPPISIRIPWPLLQRLAAVAGGGVLLALLVIVNPLRWVPKPSWPHVWLPKMTLPTLSRPQLASVTPVQDPVKPPSLEAVPLRSATPLELVVKAHRTTWIRVKADGKLVTQQRLPRGAHEQWTANKRIELVIAHPSQVDLTLNGQPIGAFAIAHQGRVAITHQGVTQLPDEEL